MNKIRLSRTPGIVYWPCVSFARAMMSCGWCVVFTRWRNLRKVLWMVLLDSKNNEGWFLYWWFIDWMTTLKVSMMMTMTIMVKTTQCSICRGGEPHWVGYSQSPDFNWPSSGLVKYLVRAPSGFTTIRALRWRRRWCWRWWCWRWWWLWRRFKHENGRKGRIP